MSPVILFIIVVLAVVFFVVAILHLLIRFLLKKQRSAQSQNYPEMPTSGNAFQRQLQQLFHLHDSGLDQAYIDALPVFLYKDIMGLKEPFDCAVCLCEFSEQDKLRLLPLCSHAFHIHCIDTWLLSNSSCPLCRGVILSSAAGISFENPVFYFGDSKDSEDENVLKAGEDDEGSAVVDEKRVFSVRLGKFKNGGTVESEVGETSNSSLGARRCYSMGSCQYVVDGSDLQVALCPSRRGERGNGDERERWGHTSNFTSCGDADGKRINNGAKGESFSVSKIWLWSKKGKFPSSTPTAHYSSAFNLSIP